jgi:DNA-binding CsgD family transcriptional regulator
MHSENATDLAKKIDLLTRLFAIHLVNGKSQREQIRLLSIAGMGPKEIADLLGTTPNTVNVTLSTLRKNRELRMKSEGGKEDVG